jgi:hypothetical protein
MLDILSIGDYLYMHFVRDSGDRSDSAKLLQAMKILSSSFIPAPTRISVDNRAPRKISAFDDWTANRVLKAAKFDISYAKDDTPLVLITPLQDFLALDIYIPIDVAKKTPANSVRELFLSIIGILSPDYAYTHAMPYANALSNDHYTSSFRTINASGLYWLNFFGPDEEKAQGGPTLADNPFATATRLPQGLLLQVCDSPIEATTPEGIERLVAATRAMPQLKQDEEDGDGELIDVGGITVAYSPSARRLVVPMLSRTIGKPIGEAEAKAIAELPQVSGLEVEQITVDFLTREIATHNREVLARHGAVSRYWDEHEREYREA